MESLDVLDAYWDLELAHRFSLSPRRGEALGEG